MPRNARSCPERLSKRGVNADLASAYCDRLNEREGSGDAANGSVGMSLARF